MYSGNALEDNLRCWRGLRPEGLLMTLLTPSATAPALGAHVRCVAGWVRLEGAADPLAGADVLGAPSLYWERPLQQEGMAGWGEVAVRQAEDAAGAAALLSELGAPEAAPALRWLEGREPDGLVGPWLGAVRFTPGEEAGWAGFGHARFVLPELLVWRDAAGLRAAAFAPEGAGGEDAVRSRLARVARAFPPHYRHPRPGALALRARGGRAEYEAGVGRVLDAVAAGRVQKVVLARAIDVQADAPFALVDVLARLREQNPRCATFLVRDGGPGEAHGVAFVGATPETLLRLSGRTLDTEALAGSADPGHADELAGWDKERREHASVVEGVLGALRPLSERVEADAAPAVLALKNVVHLRTGVRAQLRRSARLGDVVAALHPTPAVGGSPRPAALAFLAEHEGLDRGLYAGPLGWVGPGRAHLAVALRSARVSGASARLYVGAGIVAGSSAEAEWRETELKSLAMVRALAGEPNAPLAPGESADV